MLLLLLYACIGEPVADTADSQPVEEEPAVDPCDVVEIRVTGSDPPQVGDEWTLWLWCDDALMIGAMRMFFEPPDIATISENNAQFLYAGEATVTLQVGSRRQTRGVTVNPSR